MKRTSRPATDTAVSGFVSAITLCTDKLTRYVKDLTDEELNWKPTGIKNPISWILVHLTAELCCCHSVVTGKRLLFNPAVAGVAWGGVRGLEFDKDGQLPAPPLEGDPAKHLHEAWEALRTALEGSEPEWERREVYADAKMHTAWWYLTHSLCDFAYHTGQASSLRKLIAAERKRDKK
ncbi:MAG: DinB family protein [Spirochaetales bacterium]|nr:DinB family protein [Spirochaetales bacterium]